MRTIVDFDEAAQEIYRDCLSQQYALSSIPVSSFPRIGSKVHGLLKSQDDHHSSALSCRVLARSRARHPERRRLQYL